MEPRGILGWDSTLLEDLAEGLFLLDDQGRIVRVNRTGAALLGFAPGAMDGHSFDGLLSFFSPKDHIPVGREKLPHATTALSGEACRNVVMGVGTVQGKVGYFSFDTRLLEQGSDRLVVVSMQDVSPFIEENLFLKASEQHLQLLVASIDDIVFEVTVSGQILNCWTNIPGQLFFPKEVLLEKNIADLFPRAIADSFLSIIEETHRTGTVRYIEYSSPFNKESNEWYRLQTRPIHAVEDKVAVFISDITEERRIRENLKEMDLRWTFVLENSDQLLCDWDLDTNIVLVTGALAVSYGFTNDPIPVGELKERIHPEDLPQFIEQYQDCVTKKRRYLELDYRVIHPGGGIRWIRSRAVIAEWTPEGRATRMLGIGTDVTDRRRAMEEVRLNEEKFNRAFLYSGIGMALVSLTGQFMDVNKTLCKMLGYTPEELTTMTFYDCTHPDDIQADDENFEKVLRNEIETYSMEKRYRHKLGHDLWCSLTVAVVFGPNKEPIFCISQVEDISVLKQQVHVLERQKAELQLTTGHLVSSIRQMDEFNQIVAHNLRAPAGNIAMLIEQIKQSDEQADREEYLNLLEMSSNELIKILQELINVLEIRESDSVRFDQCRFADVIAKVNTQFLSEILAKNAVITTDFKTGQIWYPEIYLESILSNLLSNSLKYARHNSAPQIHVETRTSDSQVLLVFRDNGMGIDLNRYGSHLFKFRKTFHPGFEGRGIGLFMVRQQLERFGGSIAVDSQPGSGTTFTILFNPRKLKRE